MATLAKYKVLTGWEQLEHLMKHLVPPDKKKLIWRAMGRKTLALNRTRVKWQINADGSDFKSRADGSDQPMLKRTLRGKGKRGRTQVAIDFRPEGVIVRSINPVNIDQHYGFTRTQRAMTHDELVARQKKINQDKKNYKAGRRKSNLADFGARARGKYGGNNQGEVKCTRQQALVLKQTVGFKKLSFDGGKTHVRATIANLRHAFTMSQAGAIIRDYRIRHGYHPKSRWTIKVPPRDVLGISQQDEKILMLYMKALIAKYAYFQITMPDHGNAYHEWTADLMRTPT